MDSNGPHFFVRLKAGISHGRSCGGGSGSSGRIGHWHNSAAPAAHGGRLAGQRLNVLRRMHVRMHLRLLLLLLLLLTRLLLIKMGQTTKVIAQLSLGGGCGRVHTESAARCSLSGGGLMGGVGGVNGARAGQRVMGTRVIAGSGRGGHQTGILLHQLLEGGQLLLGLNLLGSGGGHGLSLRRLASVQALMMPVLAR